MTYLLLRYALDVDQDATVVEPDEPPDPKLSRGVPVGAAFPKVVVAASDPWPPVDWFRTGAMVLVSPRVSAAVAAVERHVELLPVEVNRRGGEPRLAYACLNLLDHVDVLDRDRSEFETKYGAIFRVTRVALRPDALARAEADGRALFRIAGSATTLYVIREDLAATFRGMGVTGVDVVRPEDWRFGADR